MSYIGVKINSVIQKMAGMPLMDVAFSSRSTNGLQNKIITAKKDEIEGEISEIKSDLNDKADKSYVNRNHFSTAINISDATSSTPYTFINDGYVKNAATSGDVYYIIEDENGSNLEIHIASGTSDLIYVKKGMKYYKSGGTGTLTATYKQLVD